MLIFLLASREALIMVTFISKAVGYMLLTLPLELWRS